MFYSCRKQRTGIAGNVTSVPHPIPYQGSKRRLAAFILSFVPELVDTLVEPFAGSAAVSLAAAASRQRIRLSISDSLTPLCDLWRMIVDAPGSVAEAYERMWLEQQGDPVDYYLFVRSRFNSSGDPVALLYLMARCVKNSPRFNDKGEFNQSPDHRRKGMRPDKLRSNVNLASRLLNGRSSIEASDYRNILGSIPRGSVVYMDPPYQGVSNGRDRRYHEQIDRSSFVEALDFLNAQRVDYLVSFDGLRSGSEYGDPLPEHLGLVRVLVDAGVSSQGTLLGRRTRTIESLYVSSGLAAQADGLVGGPTTVTKPSVLGLRPRPTPV